MKLRHSLALGLLVLSPLFSLEAPARLVPGTSNSLPCLVTSHGTYRLGKKPYPAGTRARWIAEGRVLARAPEGYFPRRGAPRGFANNSAGLPPIGDQGNEGSCVFWAGSYYTKSAAMKRQQPSINLNVSSNQLSPRFTYNLVNGGEDNGGYGHEPFEIFMRFGGASLAQKPYTAEQYTSLPVAADFVEGLHRRSTNYVWVWDWSPSTAEINELKAFLDAGGIAACAICADDSFDAWSPSGAPWVGPSCTANDLNHMVTVCGYGSNWYLVANSWGTSFGSNGFIFVNANYFQTYVGDVMYPLEGSYTPATNYATFKIKHGRRSDIHSLAFSVNGTTVWSNSPLPTDLPKDTGSFTTDTRANWEMAVDLSAAPWTADNTVTARCMDNVSGTAGSISNFTLRFNRTDFVSRSTPVTIPDNTGLPAYAVVRTVIPSNEPPVLAPIGNQSVKTNNLLQFTVSASDLVDSNAVTLWATGVPDWATFPGATSNARVSCAFSGTPVVTGRYAVTFYAGDKDGTNSETILIVAHDLNCVPALIVDEGFDGGLTPPAGWTFTGLGAPYTSVGNYGRASPSLRFDSTGDNIVTPALNNPTNLQFWIRGQATDSSSALLVEGYRGSTWETVVNVVPILTTPTTQSVLLAEGLTQLRFTYTKSSGNLSFDDVIIGGCGGGGTPTNHAPIITVAGGTNQGAVLGAELAFVVTVNDADTDTVGVYTSAAPMGAHFPAAVGAAPVQSTFAWTPSATGVFTATFVAYDALTSVTQGVRIVVADPAQFLAAPIIQPATGVQATRFDANWLAASNATGYRLDVATNSDFSSGGVALTNLSENFSGFTTVSGTLDRASNLDAYLQTPGWTGAKVYEDNGRAKLGSSSEKGLLTTPAVDLSANGGAATLTFTLVRYGNDTAAVVQVLHAADGSTFEQAGADLTPPAAPAQQTINLAGGTALSKVRIQAKGTAKSRFIIDNIVLTQGGAARRYVPGYESRDVGNVTSAGVTGLTVATRYYYRVRAYNVSSNSDYSGVTNVLTTAASNMPPYFTAPADTNQAGTVSNLLSFTVSASTAPDTDPVTLWAENVPDWATFAAVTNAGAVTNLLAGTPTAAATHVVTFFAGDKDGTNALTVRIVVSDAGGGPLLAPVIQAASAVNSNRFQANWLASAGATGYRLDVDTNGTFSAGGGLPVTNLTEDFAGFVAVSGTTDRASSLDTYLHTPGWTGARIYEDSGKAKLGTSKGQGLITTPTVDLSGNGGAATLVFDLLKWPSDSTVVQVLHAPNGSTFAQVGADIVAPDTMTAQTVELTGGTASSKICIQAKNTNNCRFKLDNLLLTQGGTGGDNTFVPGYAGRDVGNATSHVVTGLTVNVRYYYRVMAYSATSNSPSSGVTNVLTVAAAAEAPEVTGFTVPAGATASARLMSVAGQTYALEYTTDLAAQPVVWTPVDTQVGTGGEITLSDSTPAGEIRLYRVVMP